MMLKRKTQTTTLYLYVLDVLDYGVDTLLFGKTQMKCLKNIMAVVNQQGVGKRKSKLNCSKMLKGL